MNIKIESCRDYYSIGARERERVPAAAAMVVQYSAAFKPSNGYFHFEGTMPLAEDRHGRQQPPYWPLIGHRCVKLASDWSVEALVLISLTQYEDSAFCWFEIGLGVFTESCVYVLIVVIIFINQHTNY